MVLSVVDFSFLEWSLNFPALLQLASSIDTHCVQRCALKHVGRPSRQLFNMQLGRNLLSVVNLPFLFSVSNILTLKMRKVFQIPDMQYRASNVAEASGESGRQFFFMCHSFAAYPETQHATSCVEGGRYVWGANTAAFAYVTHLLLSVFQFCSSSYLMCAVHIFQVMKTFWTQGSLSSKVRCEKFLSVVSSPARYSGKSNLACLKLVLC